MTKNKTLCVAEWQSFGVEEIFCVLKSSELSKNDSVDSSASPQNDNKLAQNDKDIKNLNKNNDEKSDKNLQSKAQKIFAEFVKFAQGENNHHFLKFKSYKSLVAQNFVGLIQVKSGFCLEILPKTFRGSEGFKRQGQNSQESETDSIDKAKQILLTMLKSLKNSPYKQSHISTFQTNKFPLLEIFVNMFLDELERLIKKGVKSDYVALEQNRYFLKGKVLWTQNLKYNFAHKERFFTQSDEFLSDIAPNRLILSTVLFLSGQNFSQKTNTRINQIRFIFKDIKPSQNIDKDLAKCTNLRHYKSYELVLLWCKIFLKKQSFLPYFGKENAFALLFDMNKLFESFVAKHLKRCLIDEKCECQIKVQEKSKFLLTCEGKDKFPIKPDIICKHKNKTLFIADTKWKIMSDFKDILQADLYQIFAYLAKYECERGILIYLKIKGNENIKQEFEYKAKSNLNDKKHKVQIYFFDVESEEQSRNSAKIFLQDFVGIKKP